MKWSKALLKAFEWRCIATVITLLITFAATQNLAKATIFSIALHGILFITQVVWFRLRP